MSRWKDLTIAKKLSLIVTAMAVLAIAEIAALGFSVNLMSGVRSLIGGESIWSKAQKSASLSLVHYVVTHDENDYTDFLSSIRVTESDRQARAELMKPHPDSEIVKKYFRDGGIDPEDLHSVLLTNLTFFYFKNRLLNEDVASSIKSWERGDRIIDELKATAERIHRLILSGHSDLLVLKPQLLHIQKLDREATLFESEFSDHLTKFSRWLESFLPLSIFSIVLIFEIIGFTLTYQLVRRLSRGIQALSESAAKLGRGDFSGTPAVHGLDEIGTLSSAINAMGTLLEKSYANLEKRVEERTLELFRLAVENERLYQETKSVLQTREEFLSIASHELKTPLSGLYLQLQLMDRLLPSLPDGEPKERHRKNLELSLKQARKLKVLIEELLDLTRIRAGKLELKLEATDLRMVLEDCLVQLRSDITRSGSDLTVTADDSILGQFDATRIAQVMTNLLSNALKYGEGNPIEIVLRADGDQAVFAVRDRGKGICEAQHEAIFEAFERVGSHPGVSGLGLGLYITRQILVAHLGSIELESSPGDGSTFTVRIPLYPSTARLSGVSTALSRPPENREIIS